MWAGRIVGSVVLTFRQVKLNRNLPIFRKHNQIGVHADRSGQAVFV